MKACSAEHTRCGPRATAVPGAALCPLGGQREGRRAGRAGALSRAVPRGPARAAPAEHCQALLGSFVSFCSRLVLPATLPVQHHHYRLQSLVYNFQTPDLQTQS